MLEKLAKSIHPSWCLYAGIWGVILGVAYAIFTKQILATSPLWLLIAGLLLFFSLQRPSQLTLFLAFGAGFLLANFRVSPELSGKSYLAQLTGTTITLSGSIADDPDISRGSPVLHLNNLEIHQNSGKPMENSPNNVENTVDKSVEKCQTDPEINTLKLSGFLYVKLSGSPQLERSDKITLRGKLGDGFGTFAASMFRPELITIERSEPGDIFAKFKNFFAQLIHSYLPSPAADLGLGYLMGMKTGLSESFSEALSAVGMTHAVVASGTHLGILVLAAKQVFGKISKFASLLCSLLLILSFILIVGFTPSMTRAALVSALSLLVGYVGRKFTPLRLISFVAAITLLISPTNLLNLGWQLSFASFFGILIFAPRLQKTLYGGKRPPWLATMLITGIATAFSCAPILIYNFGSLSLLSLVANLLILPTLPYAMLLVMLVGALSFCSWLASFVAMVATWLLNFHIFVINLLSEKTMFIISLPAADLRIYLLYLPLFFFLIYPTFRHHRTKSRAKPPPRLEITQQLCYNEAYDQDPLRDRNA